MLSGSLIADLCPLQSSSHFCLILLFYKHWVYPRSLLDTDSTYTAKPVPLHVLTIISNSVCPKLNSLSYTSYLIPHTHTSSCIPVCKWVYQKYSSGSSSIYYALLCFEQPKYLNLSDVSKVWFQCTSLSLSQYSHSRSVEPHEASYCFHVFPVCLKIPLLDLYMPLLLILQDSVYMVIWEPSLCFNSRSKSSLFESTWHFYFASYWQNYLLTCLFLTSCSVPDTQSAPTEWINLSYCRLKTGCIAQRKQLDWNG